MSQAQLSQARQMAMEVLNGDYESFLVLQDLVDEDLNVQKVIGNADIRSEEPESRLLAVARLAGLERPSRASGAVFGRRGVRGDTDIGKDHVQTPYVKYSVMGFPLIAFDGLNGVPDELKDVEVIGEPDGSQVWTVQWSEHPSGLGEDVLIMFPLDSSLSTTDYFDVVSVESAEQIWPPFDGDDSYNVLPVQAYLRRARAIQSQLKTIVSRLSNELESWSDGIGDVVCAGVVESLDSLIIGGSS